MKAKQNNIALEIPKKDAEKIRKKLLEENLLRTDFKIITNKKNVYLPLKTKIKKYLSYTIVEKNFEKQNKKTKFYKDEIQIPEDLKKHLPSSFDIIGAVILIKIPDELKDYKKIISLSLLKTNKNVKTIYETKPVTGELRTRDVRFLAGEKKSLTVHKENQLKFFVDVKKTYFSPRLAGERKRIANLVKEDEIIIDMFTGVAPFPCVIAKYAKPKKIYGFDKNKYSIELARKNIQINKFFDLIKLFCIDSKNIKKIFKKEQVKADRVIMNLPFLSFSFLEHIIGLIKKDFVIHFYEIITKKDIEERIDKIKKIFEKENIDVLTIDYNIIKSYSPTEFYICFDITGKKNI